MTGDGLDSMSEYALKMLANKETGREILVWKKKELIRIIRQNRGTTVQTSIVAKQRTATFPRKKSRKPSEKQITATNDGLAPPPAPRRRKLTIRNDDLMTHSAKELRDIAKEHGLEVNTWNKKKLIKMVEAARRAGKTQSPRSAPPSRRDRGARGSMDRKDAPKRRPAPPKPKSKPAPPNPKPKTAPPVRDRGESVEVIALKKKLAEKEREIISLRRSISSSRPPVPRRGGSSPTPHPAQDLKKLLQEKDRQLEAVQNRQSETDIKMTSMRKELEKMKTQLADTDRRVESREKDIARKIERLEEEKDFLAQEFNTTYEKMERTKSELETLQSSRQGDSAELTELRGMLKSMREGKSDMEKQVSELEGSLTQWMTEYKALDQEKIVLHDQVSALEENNNTLVRQLSSTAEPTTMPAPAPVPRTSDIGIQAPANLSSLSKEGESFQDRAYFDEFEQTDLYNEISVYGEAEGDGGAGSKSASSDREVVVSRSMANIRTDSVATEDSLMAYGHVHPIGMPQFEDEEPTEVNILIKVLDSFEMHYSAEHWWYQDEDMETVGPVTFQELRESRDICLETYVWNGQSLPDWVRIQDLEGIQHLLPG